MSEPSIKEQVRENYARAARRVTSEETGGGCCGSAAPCGNPITSNLYAESETGALPTAAVAASLGCGNPTALAELKAGETVLDLGSGGGIDVLLSARRVGPTGKAYGLDMTDEMLALARENQRKAGAENVEFLKGEIENIPAPRQFSGRDHLELRDQSFGRQGSRAGRGLSGAASGRALRGLRRGGAR